MESDEETAAAIVALLPTVQPTIMVPSGNKANQPFICGSHCITSTYLLTKIELFYWYFSRILLKSKVITHLYIFEFMNNYLQGTPQ